jgi:hypothetical protein
MSLPEGCAYRSPDGQLYAAHWYDPGGRALEPSPETMPEVTVAAANCAAVVGRVASRIPAGLLTTCNSPRAPLHDAGSDWLPDLPPARGPHKGLL